MLPPHLPVPQGAHGGAQRAKFDALAVFVLTGWYFSFSYIYVVVAFHDYAVRYTLYGSLDFGVAGPVS